MECLFCRIVSGELKADRIYEDEQLIAFHDVNPQAPTHVLVIPREHVANVNDLTPEAAMWMGRMPMVAARIAREQGIADSGYRLVINCNDDAGQSVHHLHMHLIGGRRMQWPPG